MNYLTLIGALMDDGYSEDVACRFADQTFNPDYDSDDYDAPTNCYGERVFAYGVC